MSTQGKKTFKTEAGDIVIRSFSSGDEDDVLTMFLAGRKTVIFDLYKRQFNFKSVWICLVTGVVVSCLLWPYVSLFVIITIMAVFYFLSFKYEHMYANIRLRTDLQDITNYYNKPRHHFWVAEHNGTVVGSVSVREDGTDPMKAELLTMNVKNGYRRLGIGNTLVDTVVEFAVKNHYRELFLTTLFSMAAPRIMYERKGFTLVKIKDDIQFIFLKSEVCFYSLKLNRHD
ncbi:N-acetylaspartate synthetase-like [Glandiceps talaboti]